MYKAIIIILMLVTVLACGQDKNYSNNGNNESSKTQDTIPFKNKGLINKNGTTILSRINTPVGFERIATQNNDFANYLQNLPLKKHGTKVKYYNGSIKQNYNIYIAVIDKKIGNKNLHQCADAIMHLRADYFYQKKQYTNIHFNFTNGMNVKYSEWIKGKRIVVKGNKSYWIKSRKPSNTYNDFWNYMEKIFTYAGTYSLAKELKPVKLNNMKIGDVFIKGGFPGHGIIIVDMCINKKSGETLFVLSQSYMPAQEIQILKNNNNSKISPWYSLNFEGQLKTPEWTFNKSDLKRFD